MARVDCPRCGASVKVISGAERIRCRECGKLFRAPDDDEDDYEDEAPRRPRRKPARKKSGAGLKVALIAGGFVALAVIVTTVILVARDKGDKAFDAPTDPAKVTLENFNRVKPGMEPREVESLLGGSRSSSADDMRETLRRNLNGIEGEIEAGFAAAFAQQGEGSEWRKWEGKKVRVWVAFAQTKEGRRAAFSTALEDTGNGHKHHHGFMTWAGNTDLDKLAAVRKAEDAVRNDPKWVRGPRARGLVPGDWRNAEGSGLRFAADGKYKELDMFAFDRPGKEPTYRIEDDAHLETTKPSPFDPPPPPPPGHPAPPITLTFKPTVRRFEYFVNDEELALVEVTPNAHHAAAVFQTYYRMPIRLNGVAYTQVLRPLLAELRGTNVTQKQIALSKIERFGPGAAVALPELRELARQNTNQQLRFAYDGAINALSGPERP